MMVQEAETGSGLHFSKRIRAPVLCIKFLSRKPAAVPSPLSRPPRSGSFFRIFPAFFGERTAACPCRFLL